MQIAAMNPASVDKEDVVQTIIDRELEIAREQIRAEGKPEAMLDKLDQGKLNKLFQENTLLNQEFAKDSSKTLTSMLDGVQKELIAITHKFTSSRVHRIGQESDNLRRS